MLDMVWGNTNTWKDHRKDRRIHLTKLEGPWFERRGNQGGWVGLALRAE